MILEMKIGVISDLHCAPYSQTGYNSTFLYNDILARPINKNPVESIKQIITRQNLKCDYLLCLGDITDKMDKTGLHIGWQHLKDIKATLNAKILISTTGNHDVDSRKKHDGLFYNITKNFSTDYPIDDPDLGSDLSLKY